MIAIKRIYAPATDKDGYRVLVERLWPRGVSKVAARLDAWEKVIAPSDALRRWYDHDPKKWPEFQSRYARELATPTAQAILDGLAERARHGAVTLIYASRAGEISNAAALEPLLRERITRSYGEGGLDGVGRSDATLRASGPAGVRGRVAGGRCCGACRADIAGEQRADGRTHQPARVGETINVRAREGGSPTAAGGEGLMASPQSQKNHSSIGIYTVAAQA